MDFTGKVVLITGSASGFGKTAAFTFLQKGAKVCISDVNVDKGNETLQLFQKDFGNGNVIFCKCDVTKDEEFEALFNDCEKRVGSVDILINSAGIYNEENWQKSMETNYGGAVRGCELALKRMGKHNGGKGGTVVNMASIVGVTSVPICPFYSGAKAGLIHYTRCIGNKFHQDYSGITFHALCPDGMETPFLIQAKQSFYNSYTREMLKKMGYAGGLLKTQEVTEALFKLIEEEKPGSVMICKKNVKPYYCEMESMFYKKDTNENISK